MTLRYACFEKVTVVGICLTLVTLLSGGADAAKATVITIPSGTQIFGEIETRVTTSKKEGIAHVGDLVKAHVWRDVVVDDHIVIPAGAPVVVKVGEVKKSNFAGIKGKLRLDAISVNHPDGSEIKLAGGYDGSGKGRMGLSIGLAVAVAWPLIFIKGEQAVLEPGTLFDAAVLAPTQVAVYGPPMPRKEPDRALQVEVLYDLIEPGKKLKALPVRIQRCGASLSEARVVATNGVGIEKPIAVELESPRAEGDCSMADGTIKMKTLVKEFKKGMNQFTVEAAGMRKEVLLEMEL